jgi:hypothetical protein
VEILLVILLVAAVVLVPSAFLAWLLTLALGALGYPVPFLPVWGIVFVAGCLFGSSTRA